MFWRSLSLINSLLAVAALPTAVFATVVELLQFLLDASVLLTSTSHHSALLFHALQLQISLLFFSPFRTRSRPLPWP
ncbi:hypothetical protein Cni_G14114 [Canna indica]|uniref:Uncharacterized protein n=1 Tax=Canna indica TaxID=4628 RepID=A0AAQ3QDC5_9LILI|nr:hypothetical protein Cni_G14114 [Canna indica]